MNTRHVGLIVKKELRGLGYEKTILLAILLQLFIAMFSSFLMVGLASLYDPSAMSQYSGYRYGIAYAGNDSALKGYLQASRDFTVYEMDLSPAIAALKERKLAAVLYVPGTAPYAEQPVTVTLYALQNDLQSAIVEVKIKNALLDFERDLREVRASRLTEEPVPLAIPAQGAGGANFFEFVYGLLIPLLVFMPAFISAALVIDLITEEYQHDTLETLTSTPVSFTDIVWGKILACELLVPVQAGIWLLLLILNGITIANAPLILLHVVLGSSILTLLGALTALHYRERTAAQFIFSTALVVVVLFVLAVPSNPLNLITRLAVGAQVPENWLVLAFVGAVLVLVTFATQKYAERIRDRLQAA
jgi:ABC-type Na+ efflux pump permease subunit